MRKIFLLTLSALLFQNIAIAQPGSALDELDEITKDEPKKPDYAFATFKGVRLINGQSVEMPAKGEMIYMIAHRFGSMQNKLDDFFGLDVATMRMGFEYTLPTDFVCIGVGRSTYGKTYDGFVKVKLFRQQKGARNFPVTITLLSDIAITSKPFTNPERKNYFTSRIAYTNQVLIAHKFNSSFSMQLMPTVLHKNLVRTIDEQNTFYSMGVGGRIKLNRRLSLNAEYYGFIPGQEVPKIGQQNVRSTVAIGVDIETGGHVFQLQFTNAQAMYDGGFITETNSNFLADDLSGLRFGFNLTRTFTFGKKKKDLDLPKE